MGSRLALWCQLAVMTVAVVATHAVAHGLAQLLVIVAGSVYITDFRFLEEEEGTENIWIRLCAMLILCFGTHNSTRVLFIEIAIVAIATEPMIADANVTQLLFVPRAFRIDVTIGIHIAGNQIFVLRLRIIGAHIMADKLIFAQFVALGTLAIVLIIAVGTQFLLDKERHTASVLPDLVVATDVCAAIAIARESITASTASLIAVGIRCATLQP